MNMLEQVFNHLEPMPDDPILGLNDLFKKDERPEKVNLGVGCYLNEAGNLPLLDVVEEAEGRLAARKLPHGGNKKGDALYGRILQCAGSRLSDPMEPDRHHGMEARGPAQRPAAG